MYGYGAGHAGHGVGCCAPVCAPIPPAGCGVGVDCKIIVKRAPYLGTLYLLLAIDRKGESIISHVTTDEKIATRVIFEFEVKVGISHGSVLA